MKHDPTFIPDAAYGSSAWVALRLGRSKTWFNTHRARFMTAGFPAPDPITGLWHKASVDRWIADRAARNAGTAAKPAEATTKGVNDGEF